MHVDVVGREQELAALHAFLERPGAGPSALVLEGEPGIGKSTLWLAGLDAARERGFRVLSSRPAEAERGLAHAGLGDLLEPVLEDVLPNLLPPRRRALEAALLLSEPEGRLDPRTVAVAVRTALVALAEGQPVLLAVDDLQWLDPSSSAALAFALRRVEGERLLLLLARRLEQGIEPSPLEDAVPAEHLRLGPLSLGAVHSILQASLGTVLARPTLVRIHETSGGNPFYALELARALGPDVDPTQPLPVPGTLEGLVRRRIEELPELTREALVLVSASGRPGQTLLAAAGVGEEVLKPAFAAEVIVRDRGVIRFVHPLLESFLQQGLTAAERRRVHRSLAALVDEPLARARHFALSTDAPDPDIAAQLEGAAAEAAARGAPLAAAELGDHALRLTPPGRDEDLHRRAIAAARSHLEAGDVARPRALARQLLAAAGPGRRRIEALFLLSDVDCYLHYDTAGWLARFREALGETEDSALQAQVHERAAWVALHSEGARAGEGHARASLELARTLGDGAAAARAMLPLAAARKAAGEPDALEIAGEACALVRASGDRETMFMAERDRVPLLLETGRLDEARTELERLEAGWSGRSDLKTHTLVHFRSILELHAGELRAGAEYARRRLELASQYELENPVWMWDAAAYAAHRGDFDEARAIAEAGRLERIGARAASEAVLGFVELWSGEPEAAAGHFAEAEQVRLEAGVREPHGYWWRGDYVEALLETGHVDEAAALLDAWESEAVRLGRDRILAQVARCRGLVASVRGEVGEAVLLLEQAAARHDAHGDRLGRARALLALGRLQRRARQKRAAREALEAALAGFEQCGSEVFAAKARAELGSIGGRRREEGLTAAERRVADLVAEGKTNREVAAALFLGERTVATHLSHVYAKLGVRSRTELARTLRPAS